VKSRVAYLTQNCLALSLSLLRELRPKSARAGGKQYTQCLKFHPNPFTSGGVIAERVNIVQTRHKMFPILGEAIASSPSNDQLIELIAVFVQHSYEKVSVVTFGSLVE